MVGLAVLALPLPGELRLTWLVLDAGGALLGFGNH